MSDELLCELRQRAAGLTAAERVAFGEYLLAEASAAAAETTTVGWMDLCGVVEGSYFGEEAQTAVTRTRQEWDERRTPALGRGR